MTSTLFTPLMLGGYHLRNRFMMAPMTRARAGDHGVPCDAAPTYYAQRASAGLLVSEATHVAPEGAGGPGIPGIFSEAQAAGWHRVTSAVHEMGGRIFLQLWHAGRVSHPSLLPEGALPVAPSALAASGTIFTAEGRREFVTPRALEVDEIDAIVGQFDRAARLARVAGFDGLDLHAATGYLIDQFLRDGANRRTDPYGGGVPNRLRLLLEILDAVFRTWPPSHVGVRLSPLSGQYGMSDSNPAELFGAAATALADRGVGYLHVVEHGPGHPSETAAGRQLIAIMRRRFPGVVVVDGGCDLASAEAARLASGADMVAFATPFIANPDLVERLTRGLPLASADPSTYYAGGDRGYVDYPCNAPPRRGRAHSQTDGQFPIAPQRPTGAVPS